MDTDKKIENDLKEYLASTCLASAHVYLSKHPEIDMDPIKDKAFICGVMEFYLLMDCNSYRLIIYVQGLRYKLVNNYQGDVLTPDEQLDQAIFKFMSKYFGGEQMMPYVPDMNKVADDLRDWLHLTNWSIEAQQNPRNGHFPCIDIFDEYDTSIVTLTWRTHDEWTWEKRWTLQLRRRYTPNNKDIPVLLLSISQFINKWYAIHPEPNCKESFDEFLLDYLTSCYSDHTVFDTPEITKLDDDRIVVSVQDDMGIRKVKAEYLVSETQCSLTHVEMKNNALAMLQGLDARVHTAHKKYYKED